MRGSVPSLVAIDVTDVDMFRFLSPADSKSAATSTLVQNPHCCQSIPGVEEI